MYEYREAWKRAVRAAGCPNLTPHDLRRTAIRNSWHATHDRRNAMMLSGHATESVFERYNVDAGAGGARRRPVGDQNADADG